MRHTAGVPAAAMLVAVLLAGGCAGSAAAPPRASGTPTGAAPVTASRPPGPAGTPSPSGPFNGTDIAWLQLAVAMHERVLPLLDLVPERTTDPAVRRLATRIRETHRADLERCRRLLDRSGAPKTNPHEGHDMPGMVTAAQLTALGSASEAEFRRLFGQYLRAHLAQSVRVAGAEQRSGADPDTTSLAGAIARTGTGYLTQLDRLPD
ncbi:DUF305 domain-containing protein [Plantactinospora sp. KLBMP9567]|uniref:DUF305 domain-containing protein n=1 Tax=Plantactinospora sp. KLBMP9567 TaxID=3085900 RepID=UPI002981C154|nr:DUF305 domain-containing protein [Plantactinospora sp. KLBMP9567]MDW5330792.1 DUF305 domain-containing protein [Plantactinospora sp. KLBMP9567]